MPRFRKKPVIIEAEQVAAGLIPDGCVEAALCERCHARLLRSSLSNFLTIVQDTCPFCHGRPGDQKLVEGVIVRSAMGDTFARIGDWIVTGIGGCRYAVHADVFERTYEPEDA